MKKEKGNEMGNEKIENNGSSFVKGSKMKKTYSPPHKIALGTAAFLALSGLLGFLEAVIGTGIALSVAITILVIAVISLSTWGTVSAWKALVCNRLTLMQIVVSVLVAGISPLVVVVLIVNSSTGFFGFLDYMLIGGLSAGSVVIPVGVPLIVFFGVFGIIFSKGMFSGTQAGEE